jgi:hypothetical protein
MAYEPAFFRLSQEDVAVVLQVFHDVTFSSRQKPRMRVQAMVFTSEHWSEFSPDLSP